MRQATDNEILGPIFAARIRLAKGTEADAAAEAVAEWHRQRAWVKSNKTGEGTFLDLCDIFDFEPDAVRREVFKEKN